MKDPEANMAARMRRLNVQTRAARTRLTATAATARQRLRPGRLASDAGDRLADAMLDNAHKAKISAREHPLKALGIAALFGAFLARRPLTRLAAQGVDTLWRRLQEARLPQTTEDSEASEDENGA